MTALGDFSAGDVLTAANLNAIGTWTTFTPTLKFGSNTITPGVQDGRYIILNELIIVSVRAYNLTYSGNGILYLSLPSGAAVSGTTVSQRVGYAYFFDNSLSDNYMAAAYMVGSSTTEVAFLYSTTGLVTNTTPFAFLSGSDEIDVTIIARKA